MFISYASEDREAARRLRDILASAGLDVWYDESELGGGDAWDQKIRRQIRECDYFMPVVSATTERRKEGYFRREWRLAVERTLDMADDVMFLLPVTIDGTSEANARVPDKFLTVQWLHLPGGANTPALDSLCRRLAAGDHSLPPPRAFSARESRAASRPAATPTHADGPPPMPPFPHLAEKAGMTHGLKFGAEVGWWAITAGWLLRKRAPRWLRILLSLWVAFTIIGQCSRGSKEQPDRAAPELSAADKAQLKQAIDAATANANDAGKKNRTDDGSKLGAKIARGLAAGLKEIGAADKRLVVVPFKSGAADQPEAKFLDAVFAPLYGRLAVERAGDVAVSSDPLPTATNDALLARGRQLDAEFILGGRVETEAGATVLVVSLIRIDDGSTAWSGRFPSVDGGAPAAAEQITTAVLATVPKE